MIGPSGGGGFVPLYTLLWAATLFLVAVAGLVAWRRWARGDRMRRGPVMNRTVRGLGVLAAVCFVGYWFANADRRELEVAFDDVVETIGADEADSFTEGRIDDSRVLCRESGSSISALNRSALFEHADGESGALGVPRAAVAELEEFGVRLESDGWTVRRFLGEAEARLWARRDGVFALLVLRPSRSARFSLSVTTEGCLGRNYLPLSETGEELEPDFFEVDVFEP